MPSCSNCEMYYPETKTCFGCLSEMACESPERCGTPVIHECPEPFPYETASYLARAGPILVSGKTRARILLGLREGRET